MAVPADHADSSRADIAKVLNDDGCAAIADLASAQTMDQIWAELDQHPAGNADFLGADCQAMAAVHVVCGRKAGEPDDAQA